LEGLKKWSLDFFGSFCIKAKMNKEKSQRNGWGFEGKQALGF
jgi:hypothetical protein